MTDYIDREAVITLLRHQQKQRAARNAILAADEDEIIRFLKLIPAADVRSVGRGLWIWDDEGYHCSECFYHAYGCTDEVLTGAYRYCPNCGAEMEGEE